jgi:hypothetical protein
MVGEGADDQGKPVAFDIHFATHQTAGSVTEQGQKIELINLGGSSLYFKLPGALWKQLEGADAEAKFAGKWVKAPQRRRRSSRSSRHSTDSHSSASWSPDRLLT